MARLLHKRHRAGRSLLWKALPVRAFGYASQAFGLHRREGAPPAQADRAGRLLL